MIPKLSEDIKTCGGCGRRIRKTFARGIDGAWLPVIGKSLEDSNNVVCNGDYDYHRPSDGSK